MTLSIVYPDMSKIVGIVSGGKPLFSQKQVVNIIFISQKLKENIFITIQIMFQLLKKV